MKAPSLSGGLPRSPTLAIGSGTLVMTRRTHKTYGIKTRLHVTPSQPEGRPMRASRERMGTDSKFLSGQDPSRRWDRNTWTPSNSNPRLC